MTVSRSGDLATSRSKADRIAASVGDFGLHCAWLEDAHEALARSREFFDAGRRPRIYTPEYMADREEQVRWCRRLVLDDAKRIVEAASA